MEDLAMPDTITLTIPKQKNIASRAETLEGEE